MAGSDAPPSVERRRFRTPRSIAVALQASRQIADDEFDQFFAARYRETLRAESTPVSVATRAAKMLTGDGVRRVLDLGSGVGKFCTIGALATPGWFVGVERDPHFVVAARSAAGRFGCRRVEFLCEDAAFAFMAAFDAIYVFPDKRACGARPLSMLVLTRLRLMGRGTRLVTYGPRENPAGWQLVQEDDLLGNRLACFEKT